jgi:hypothetical protein
VLSFPQVDKDENFTKLLPNYALIFLLDFLETKRKPPPKGSQKKRVALGAMRKEGKKAFDSGHVPARQKEKRDVFPNTTGTVQSSYTFNLETAEWN